MKRYRISIPEFAIETEAKNKREAIEQFWFDYDCAQEDSGWGEPTITEIKAT